MQKRKDKVVILGLGNLLLGDEGVGIHIIKKIKTLKLPPYVEVIDGDTAGFNLISIFKTHRNDKFIIVDAIGVPATIDVIKNSYDEADNISFSKFNKKGDIYVIPLEKLYKLCCTNYDNPEFVSFHQIGLFDVISLLLKTLKIKIKGYLIGINICEQNTDSEIINLKYSMRLSKAIKQKIPNIVDLILKYI